MRSPHLPTLAIRAHALHIRCITVTVLLAAGALGCSADETGPAADAGAAQDTGGTLNDVADSGGVDAPTGDTTASDANAADATSADAATDAGPTADGGGVGGDTAGDATGDATSDATNDATSVDANDGGPADTTPVKVCNAGEKQCAGAKLATCGALEDGWIESNCFPGTTCSGGACVPVSNNLVIAFDTSGSMTAAVAGCTATGQTWPTCDPTKGCSRMDVSKQVFTAALKKIDANATRMALFRFPQKLYQKTTSTCANGFYQGQSALSGELSPGPSNAQFVDDTALSNWYWQTYNETMCVRFPPDGAFKTKEKIAKWMDGTEVMSAQGTCTNSSTVCKPVAGCAGTCCSGQCWVHTDPELRPTGGTPIGKTLFYVAEYLKNRVVIDGKLCKTDGDCDNANYSCKSGKCKDVARTCRETVVVLFTDGGESNNASNFFGPWVQAKRMAYGLCCQSDADCVGGTTQNPTACKSGKCLPKTTVTGYYCTKGMAPCLPGSASGEATFCAGECVADPMSTLTACATNPTHNVLRSPDGKPFGVRVHIVDISGAASIKNSMSLALSGNGKLLGIDAADPNKFLEALTSVFDIKTQKVCDENL